MVAYAWVSGERLQPHFARGLAIERRAIRVRGLTQGVGFRPFVYRLADRLHLAGFVRNERGSVLIEVEGEEQSLDRFVEELTSRPPRLARIESVDCRREPTQGEREFQVEPSRLEASATTIVPADVATCVACLSELFDPNDRRYRYPFLNCTDCGPRLTIIEGTPYDRSRTTMAAFTMCADCRREYENPRDRRFHAQPTACPRCGPRLELRAADGTLVETSEPLIAFATRILAGGIGLVKGLGGCHLVCDARNAASVSELRRRKGRDEKPLAVMVATLEAAGQLCDVSSAERALLASPRRPIVLLRKLHWPAGCSQPLGEDDMASQTAEQVAPVNPYLGVMLPYTPLHHLLMHEVGGAPLVMTSGNRSDEPIATNNEEALARLHDVADIFLLHDRPIHIRCDDSVTRVLDSRESPLRRSRGDAPMPIALPIECELPILALGGQDKSTFALGEGGRAFLSHHLGNLEHFDAYKAFERDVGLYEALFETSPPLLVHDLHPDYASTRYAKQRARQEHLPLLGVQHHHAHMASCMAEHGLTQPAIGVIFDGTGYGIDEISGEPVVFGAEFLVGDYIEVKRAAHFRYIGLPGGEKVAREPWRTAAAHLIDAGCGLSLLESRIDSRRLRAVESMLSRHLNSPLASSAGRLFDAAAVICRLRERTSYEGQAAVELEWTASCHAPDESYPYGIEANPQGTDIIDTRPLIRAMAADVESGLAIPTVARRFHSTLIDIIAHECDRIRTQTGLDMVVLSGGVFMNVILHVEVARRLVAGAFHVYRHHVVPCNDGGLCLGQLAIAAAWARAGKLEPPPKAERRP